MVRIHAFGGDALGDLDAVGLVEKLRAGDVSASELVEAAIARTEAVNPKLNGLAYEAFDRARARADARRPYGGYFDGVPSFIKDNVAVAGMPTMQGTDAWDPHPMPTDGGGDGYGYDLAVNPKKNVLLTSSFAGFNNYMRPLGELIKDGEAMKKFGSSMVVWDLKAMKPAKVFKVPGAPLEIRWSLNPKDSWAITAAALTSKLWLVKQDASGQWAAKEVATIGDPSKVPLPVDISITRDGKGLWVNTFMDGTTRYFDLSNPEAPKQTYEKVTGKQINMISQSWDGKRLYITSSLLANWDKGGADNEQFIRGFAWDGSELTRKFEVDFTKEKLGRAHHMKLGTKAQRATVTGG